MLCGGNIGHLGRNGNFVESFANDIYERGNLDLESEKMIAFWKNKKVLLTGHTGYKGTWMALMLE
mgnify:CR=1 FL=1